jgi:hypothetical protein
VFQSVTSSVARFGDKLVLLSVASTGDVVDPATVGAVLRDVGVRLGE